MERWSKDVAYARNTESRCNAMKYIVIAQLPCNASDVAVYPSNTLIYDEVLLQFFCRSNKLTAVFVVGLYFILFYFSETCEQFQRRMKTQRWPARGPPSRTNGFAFFTNFARKQNKGFCACSMTWLCLTIS